MDLTPDLGGKSKMTDQGQNHRLLNKYL